jgi:hypothetical protein
MVGYVVRLMQDIYDAINEICFHKEVPNRYFERLNPEEGLMALECLREAGLLEQMCSSHVHELFGIRRESSEI